MNRERAKELLPIIEAFANGEEIQFRDADFAMVDSHELDWCDLPKNELLTLTFPCDDYEYRIKPKPREWYARPNDLHDHAPNGECETTGCIKVVEVL